MNMKKYISIPNTIIPREIKIKLKNSGNITKTKFENKNEILLNDKLHSECGYAFLEDDNCYLVSVSTPMPRVTKEMVTWWFWWHAQNSERYRAWYPNEHISISYSKKNKKYFTCDIVPEFEPNTHYPVERVGKLIVPLSIDFVTPKSFGFYPKYMNNYNIETIVCGHVGAFYGLIPNTEMAHIFIKSEKGLLLVSRFWLGKNLSNNFIKKVFVTEKQAKSMAEHCYIEYRNFAQKIPFMYREWNRV